MLETQEYILKYLSSLIGDDANSNAMIINYKRGNDIFIQDLNIYSIEIMEFIMDLESRYNIEMDYDELMSKKTVKKLIDYNVKKL